MERLVLRPFDTFQINPFLDHFPKRTKRGEKTELTFLAEMKEVICRGIPNPGYGSTSSNSVFTSFLEV